MPENVGGHLRRAGAGFVAVYLALYTLPFPLGFLPGTDGLRAAYDGALTQAALWVGRHVLGLAGEIPLARTGSGDRTVDYLVNLCLLALAVLVTAVWALAAPRVARLPRAEKLAPWLGVYLRYALATTMLSYGYAKLFGTQFPFPSPARLVQPYGQSSPMGLLWTFMGYSAVYSAFTGAAECLGGVLLFARRTTSLGALVTLGVMSNVVMLNFTYDVPVKLFSIHLCLTALFLLAPDLRRLRDVLVLNRAAAPRDLHAPAPPQRLRRAVPLLKALVVVWALLQPVFEVQALRRLDAARPIYGLYEVEEFIRDGRTEEALVGNARRWRYVTLEGRGVRVNLMDDSLLRFRVRWDHERGSLEIEDWFAPGTKSVLTTAAEGERLVLAGEVGSERVRARLRRVDAARFLLVTRGFHWINEVPYNR